MAFLRNYMGDETTLADHATVLTQWTGPPIGADPDDMSNRWIPVSVGHNLVSTSYEGEALTILQESPDGGTCSRIGDTFIGSGIEPPNCPPGVVYNGTVPPITPNQIQEACNIGFPCTFSQAQQMSTENLRRRCLEVDGQFRHSRIGETYEECRQLNFVAWLELAKPHPSREHEYRFTHLVRSQIGYQDNFKRDQPQEEIGLGWDDGGGWQLLESFEIAGGDRYWCTEETTSQSETGTELFQFNYWHRSDVDNAPINISPYGVSGANPWQWRRTRDVDGDGWWTTCVYWHPSGFGMTPVARAAVVRFHTHLISVDAKTHRNQFEGTAIGSFGHKWSEWAYDWSIGGRLGCTSTGCRASAAFSFRPYQEERAAYFSYPRNYEHGF